MNQASTVCFFLSPFNTQNPYRGETASLALVCSAHTQESCQPEHEKAITSPGAPSCLLQRREGESRAGKRFCSPSLNSFAVTQRESVAVKAEEATHPAVPVPRAGGGLGPIHAPAFLSCTRFWGSHSLPMTRSFSERDNQLSLHILVIHAHAGRWVVLGSVYIHI